jgi:PAS domain S-box-containing protein
MWVYDLETFAFLAVNEATISHYGYGREEFLGMTIMDIRPASEVPALLEHLCEPVPAFGHAGVWIHRKKDGTLIEVEITSHELTFGERKARLVLGHDITERRRVEAARERLIAILEGTPDLVAISQVGGPISYLNPAGQRLLGIGPQEAVALSDYRPPWVRKVIREEAIPTAIREGVWSGETVLVSKAGEEVPVSQVLIAHKAPSGAVEFLSTIARDIREQKRLEEQLRQAQKMEAVGRLAGGVAHDFNNLLTIIIGYSEVVLNSLRPPDPLRDLIEEIRKAGTAAAGLTRQLLAFSRKQVLVPIVLDLNVLLVEMEKMLGRLLGEDVDLAVCPGQALWRVKVDAGQMEQVILNLAVNARDAMPQGGKLTIETANVVLDDTYVTAHAEARPGEHVVLAVSDTGSGMDSGTRDRIFEPFFTTKGPEKGTGLGLATVYGIVKQSGGHIEVYSEPGHGSTFKVYLPRDGEEASSDKARSPLTGTPRGTETVLLVEDEEGVRSLARQVLESNGYTVLEASHGGEALRTWERYTAPIHLLITDVVMPNMSGRQLAERLLELRPGMKVLYLSGYMDDAIVRHGILRANTPFLQKPFTPDTLAQKVREVLDC